MNNNDAPVSSQDQFDFQKSLKPEDKFRFLKYFRVERFFTRPIASLIVRALYKTPVTPNHLTYVGFLLGIIGSIIYCFGTPTHFLVAGLIIQFSSVFDCADGMLARSKNMCTRYGAYLDLFLDRIVDLFVMGGIAIGYFLYSKNLLFFIACIFAIGFYFLQVTTYYLIREFQRETRPGEAAAARGLTAFAIFVFSILNRLDILYVLIMLEVTIYLAVRVIQFPTFKEKFDKD